MAQANDNTDDVKDVKDDKDVKTPDTEAGTTGTDPVDNTDGGEEMVSKAEAQKMADAMVAKKLKGMPSKEELAEYKKWKDDQKTAEEKRAEQEEKYRQIEAENTSLKHEREILNKGVKSKDVDYVLFKVSKMEGEDFGENLDKFLEENPEYLTTTGTKKTTDGVPVKRSTEPTSNSVTDILKKRNPNLNL